MKKNYFNLLLVLFFGLCFTQKGFAQLPIVANDDVLNNINSAQGGFFYNTFLNNDTLNGNSVSTFSVSVQQISTTDPGVYVTQGGVLNVSPGTPAGTYTVVYQICQSNFPNNCDTANITVNVCNVPAPAVELQTCDTPANEVTFNNLPENGPWTITFSTQWPPSVQTFTGTGTTTTIPGIDPEYYTVQVTDSGGCVSPSTGISVGSLGGMNTPIEGYYQDSNSDGVVNIGDVIYYHINIQNESACELNDVEVTSSGEFGASVAILGSPVASILPGTSATVTVFYPITQEDINNGVVIYNWFAVKGDLNGYQVYSKAFDQEGVALNIPDGFKLNAFIDTNGNGTQDNSETDFELGYFQYILNDNEDYTTNISATNDPIIYETASLNSFNVTFFIYPEYASNYMIQTPTINNITVPTNSGVTTYSFPITVTPYEDVSVHIYNATNASPGFDYVNYIQYTNHGNQTLTSGTIALTSNTSFPITTTEAVTATPNGFTFNFIDLLPFETRTIMFTMQVPVLPIVSLGDIITNTVSITPPTGDMLLPNNSSVVTTTIVGSYDPNDKAENHDGKILHNSFTEEDYLTYTIRFENTGTANTQFIWVVDLLDSKLDPTSVRMIGTSHDYTLRRIGSQLNWNFYNVQLPPSIPNTQIGHGHIAFKVKPKPGYAVGDIIENTASIFFDFNPPIVTNTTSTEFVTLLNIDDFVSNELKVYPNPVKNLLNVVSNNSTVESILVYDLLGKTILSKSVNGTSTMIDVSGLSNGIYLVKVVAAQGEKVFKIVKE